MDQSITHALVPVDETMRYSMVMPLATPEFAKQAIDAYESLKSAIVREEDKFIYGKGAEARVFLKKSFWRRVATCFGLTLDLVSEQRGFDEQNKLFYSVLYRAVAPNGRTMIGDGYCSTAESGHGSWPEHTVRATAHTRAKNRAISDLVGGGEVSAEEMPDDEPVIRPAPMKQGYAKIPAIHERRIVEEPRQPERAPEGMTLNQFVMKVRDNLDLSPKQAMERLGVKSLSGLNLEDAYELLQKRDISQEQPSQNLDAVDIAAWNQLHIRFSAAGGNMADWEQLLKEGKGDIEEALKFVERMERTDLSKLPKAAGVH